MSSMSKTRTGIVTACQNSHSVTVRVDRMISHPKYGKRFRVSKKFAAHDPKDHAKLGDLVTLQECKPISKTKKWLVTEVVKPAVLASEVVNEPSIEAES